LWKEARLLWLENEVGWKKSAPERDEEGGRGSVEADGAAAVVVAVGLLDGLKLSVPWFATAELER
jgi:hypothetical protein